jgi:hypothetical protein
VRFTIEDQAGYTDRHLLEGGRSLVAPLPGTAGFARLFGIDHSPRQAPFERACRADHLGKEVRTGEFGDQPHAEEEHAHARLVARAGRQLDPAVPRRLVIEDKTFPRVRSRYVECYYSDGWEGDESEEASGLTWRRIPLELKCPDPWFREDGEESFTFSADDTVISIPELLGGLAWPTFHIQLPYGAENPEVTNQTSGKSFRLEIVSGAVLLGEDGEELVLGDDEGFEPDIVEVVTAPRFRTVRRNEAISWDIWDFSSDWFSVKSGDEVSMSVEELEEYPGWTALMTLNPYHRKGL